MIPIYIVAKSGIRPDGSCDLDSVVCSALADGAEVVNFFSDFEKARAHIAASGDPMAYEARQMPTLADFHSFLWALVIANYPYGTLDPDGDEIRVTRLMALVDQADAQTV